MKTLRDFCGDDKEYQELCSLLRLNWTVTTQLMLLTTNEMKPCVS